MKKPTPKQRAARELFAQRARAGEFARSGNPARGTLRPFERGIVPAHAHRLRNPARGTLRPFERGIVPAHAHRLRNPEDGAEVARTILAQLGGHRFIAMTGAKNLVHDANSLMFSLPARLAREGINKVRIELTPEDTYAMRFMKYSPRTLRATTVHELDNVYADALRQAFTRYTGLDVSIGRNPAPRFKEPPDPAYALKVGSQWVVGVASGTRRLVLGPRSRAVFANAERAAIAKARLESEGHAVQVVPVDLDTEGVARYGVDYKPRKGNPRAPKRERAPFYYLIESRPPGYFQISLRSDAHTLEAVKARAQALADKHGVQAAIRELHV